MKYIIFRIKQGFSLTAFILLISVLILKLKESSLERKIDQIKVIQVDTVYLPLPKKTIITP